MEITQQSLLLRARRGEEAAWRRLVELYRPLVFSWLVRRQVLAEDAEDLTQDVMAVLVKELPRFEHAGRPGAFRSWLRGITVNRVRGFWRAGSIREVAVGGSEVLEQIDELADPASALSTALGRGARRACPPAVVDADGGRIRAGDAACLPSPDLRRRHGAAGSRRTGHDSFGGLRCQVARPPAVARGSGGVAGLNAGDFFPFSP